MGTHFLFDVDGTLTPARQPMDPNFAINFQEWAENHTFSLVSGSDIAKIKEQIPESILASSVKVFACAGNAVYEWARQGDSNSDFECTLVEEHPFIACSKLTAHLEHELRYCNWQGLTFDTHFEARKGLLNFSILGRGANQEWRDKYEEWDKQDGERQRIVNSINQNFQTLHASAGGQISIDICEKGRDKSQVLNYINLTENSIVFYGDKTKLNGNDYPLAQAIKEKGCGVTIQVDSWKEVEDSLGLKSVLRKTIGKKNKNVGFTFAKES